MYRDPSLPSLAPTTLPIFRRAATHFTPMIKALLGDMEMVKKDDLFAKFVIFSQYKETLLVMQSILAAKNIQSSALVTSTSLDNQSSLRTFNQDPNYNVLLLTTGVAAT
jgi:SNF2 family DNA or RNA helicase